MNNKTMRLAILLVVLAAAVAFYFLRAGGPPEALVAWIPKPTVALEPVSAVKEALRRGAFAELDTLLTPLEEAAAGDSDAERRFNQTLGDLAHATDDELQQLERWAQGGSHYAHLALARSHRIRSFFVRSEGYVNQIDPVRFARFRDYTQKSYAHAEHAAKLHANCGVAYAQMIEALVGVSDRQHIDAVFARSQQAAAQWHSPLLAYIYALYPSWYGEPGERQQFIQRFAQQHPDHRGVARMQAKEYVDQAASAIRERKYGEAMILADLALKKDPLNSNAYENKARAFYGVQRAMDALPVFDKAVELDPHNDSALRYRGQLRLVMGRADGQDDYVRAGLLGDSWALKQAMWNWLTGNTTGVVKDWSRIPEMCERSRQYGMPDGLFCVATVHFFGYGVPQDAKKGVALMQEAADLGVADAMSDVGKMFWQGKAEAGVARDKERALRYWMRAAAIGNDRALVELSQVKNDPEILTLIEKIRSEDVVAADGPKI